MFGEERIGASIGIAASTASSSGRPAQDRRQTAKPARRGAHTSTPIGAALDQEMDRTGIEIDRRKRRIVAIEARRARWHRRDVAAQMRPTAGMGHERDRAPVPRTKAPTSRVRSSGSASGGMERAVDRPFQPRHIGEIEQRRGRREMPAGNRETRCHSGRDRRCGADAAAMKMRGRAFEELVADQADGLPERTAAAHWSAPTTKVLR